MASNTKAQKAAPASKAPPPTTTTTASPISAAGVTGYDTDLRFYATRYKQGGRWVYALDLSLDQITSLIAAPDPSKTTPGNRAIREGHAKDFAKYLREHAAWVVPGMILRAPAIFDFESITTVEGTEFGIVSFPRLALTDLHILDGQHRILGLHLAKRGIADDLDKARSQLAAARRADPDGGAVVMARERIKELEKQRDRLANERISLQVFVEEDLAAYRQMFFDIADNALGITASVKARFDARKVVNRALVPVLEHPLLENRVDMERDRPGRGSPYIMAAKQIAEIVRSTTVGLEGRVSRRQEASLKEQDVAAKAKDFFDLLTESFPPFAAILHGQITAEDLRKTSLLGSVLVVRILAGVEFELVEHHGFTRDMVKAFFAKLAPHMVAPVHENSIWVKHVPIQVFAIGGYAPNGRRQDTAALRNTIVEWAIDKPEFIDAPPAPRPALEPSGDSGELTSEKADEILRPETARARAEAAEAK